MLDTSRLGTPPRRRLHEETTGVLMECPPAPARPRHVAQRVREAIEGAEVCELERLAETDGFDFNSPLATGDGLVLPLLLAAPMGLPAVVSAILDAGASPHSVNEFGQNALHLAALGPKAAWPPPLGGGSIFLRAPPGSGGGSPTTPAPIAAVTPRRAAAAGSGRFAAFSTPVRSAAAACPQCSADVGRRQLPRRVRQTTAAAAIAFLPVVLSGGDGAAAVAGVCRCEEASPRRAGSGTRKGRAALPALLRAAAAGGGIDAASPRGGYRAFTAGGHMGETPRGAALPARTMIGKRLPTRGTVGWTPLLDESVAARCSTPPRGRAPQQVAEEGLAAVAEVLLERGTNPKQQDVHGMLPDQYAREQGRTSVVEVITRFALRGVAA